jgi:type IV pilus assembly protein PilP
MIKKNIDEAEIPAVLMDNLRRGFACGPQKAIEECDLAESAIAYAFEELAPDEQKKVERHLQSCRFCMNLVLDSRAAETEAQAQCDRPAKVLSALSAAINRPTKPSFIERLAAGFKMPAMAPRIIAMTAAACFAVPIAYYALKDPAAVKKMPVVTRQIAPAQIEERKQNQPPSIDPQEERSSLGSISTREEWATDPFEPLFNGKHGRVVAKKKRAKRVPRTPLETLDLSQVKLVAVLLSDKGNTALVEDATGKGYAIKEGTYIGMNTGRVVEILKDRFIVLEEIKDVHGKIIPQKTVIKLNKP